MKRNNAFLIREIREYLDANLDKPHAIPELCRQFNINRNQLQAGFHDLVESTVHAYIVRQRIRLAAQRLQQSEDSIKAIALESGYRKQRSFHKAFKAVYHLTPAAYRRVHQQK